MLMQKLIIEARVSGQRETNSHAPYSPEEIAVAALECWRQGASIVHYHARDPETGKPSSDPELYAATVWRIKQECDLITMPTLGASMLPTAEERVAASSRWRRTRPPSLIAYPSTWSRPTWIGMIRTLRISPAMSMSTEHDQHAQAHLPGGACR